MSTEIIVIDPSILFATPTSHARYLQSKRSYESGARALSNRVTKRESNNQQMFYLSFENLVALRSISRI